MNIVYKIDLEKPLSNPPQATFQQVKIEHCQLNSCPFEAAFSAIGHDLYSPVDSIFSDFILQIYITTLLRSISSAFTTPRS